MADVVVIGGGPAGLTLGCYLAEAGIGCVVVERAHHPRPHVGESLMPGAMPILREIGFLDILDAAGFPRSHGVAYHPADGREVALPYRAFPHDGVVDDHTYHVDRARFDMLLLKHAESLGCRVLEGVSVQRVLFDGARATGVQVTVADQVVDLPARVVVDAGGRATRLGRQLDLRREHPVLDQLALHAWLVGVDRGGRRDTERYTHVYFLPGLRGWAWRAPIDDEITSIGVVADRRVYQKSGHDVDTFFTDALAMNPALAEATRDARRINDIKGEVNYSYRLERLCGDGWLAIGDAALFIDPVFSSGVSVAMHTARFAAQRIEHAVRTGDFGRASFLPYEEEMLAGATIWDEFIRLFYRLLPSFVHLLESDDHRGPLLRMIQGDLDTGSALELIDEMRALQRTVEESDDHPWKGELLDL